MKWEFQIMKLLNTYSLEIKKSKFIAYYYEVTTQKEIKEQNVQLRKEHKKAKHIPYAYVLANTAGKSEDKEPSGTAGLPLYNLLLQKGIKNRALFVVRYFGGLKLGAGGLIRAYLEAGKNAIEEIENTRKK